MTPDDWNRIKVLFDEALERPPEERAAFLDRACSEDSTLRTEVDALLAAHDRAQADRALESPFVRGKASGTGADDVEPGSPSDESGQRVGPYRLVRRLGRGGMGTVYLAERDDGQFRQTVALKLIRRGLDTDDTLSRFSVERQILAGLDHPNIAHLYDGGVTDDGRPYFAMEHVEGEPITDYCDRRRLSTAQRLELFETVCRAVQHAHRNLVVHRDLKPSNILVTDTDADESGSSDPTVKLLDFGIAKLLADEVLGRDPSKAQSPVPHTRTGRLMLTPEYAAPEQLRGAPITTATDVYQLGVLLYELLTGRGPYALENRMHHAVAQAILETDPERPSTAVTRTAQTWRGDDTETVTPRAVSQARSTDPARLKRQLAGDLDVICLKALHKEPARRYPDVDALADDVRRHQAGRPVTARPDGLAYRAGKFVRRHRVGVAAALFVVLSIVGGAGAALWQAQVADWHRQEAEERLVDVRQLAGSFLFEFHDAIADQPGTTAARELVVRRALEYLDRLAQQTDPSPALSLELATAYRKVGDVQGNPTNANLGRPRDALASYQKGLAWIDGAAHPGSTNVTIRDAEARLHEGLGDVQAALGQLDEAETSKRRVTDIYQGLVRDRTADPHWQTRHAVALIKWGDVLGNSNFPNQGRAAEALRHYQKAEAILGRLYAADSSASNTMRLYGLIHERIGTIREQEGPIGAALEAYRRSMALRERYADAHPTDTDAIRDGAVAHEKMGKVLVQRGELATAQAHFQTSRDIFRQLADADPENAQAKQSLAISYFHLGDLAHHTSRPSLNDPATARTHYEQAQRHLTTVCTLDSTNTHAQHLLGLVNDRLTALSSPGHKNPATE